VSTARNVAIVLVLAAAVAFIPGGGTTAGLVGGILSTLIFVSLVFFAYRFYREHRLELDGLGDRWRGLLYGAIAAVVLALAALPRLQDTSGGTLVVVVVLGAAAYAFYAVWRHYREYAGGWPRGVGRPRPEDEPRAPWCAAIPRATIRT
jgi:hypothetical protein